MLSSPLKDGRRVLGDKTTNASSRVQNSKEAATTSPTKTVRNSPAPKIFVSNVHAGQKRSIDQLDGAKDHSALLSTPGAHPQRQGRFQIFGDSTAPTTSPHDKVRAIYSEYIHNIS
jgi:hypothetical protein